MATMTRKQMEEVIAQGGSVMHNFGTANAPNIRHISNVDDLPNEAEIARLHPEQAGESEAELKRQLGQLGERLRALEAQAPERRISQEHTALHPVQGYEQHEQHLSPAKPEEHHFGSAKPEDEKRDPGHTPGKKS